MRVADALILIGIVSCVAWMSAYIVYTVFPEPIWLF